MDGDAFHGNVLLTAFVLKQVVLAHHHTVRTVMTDKGEQETKKIKQAARSSLLKMEQRSLRRHVTCLKVKTVKYCPNPRMQ